MRHEDGRIEWLPAARRLSVPWKNGGGITREIAVSPAAAALAAFDWRVSTAEVRGAGPFSSFPGIERTLCVLEGTLSLEVAGRAAAVLNPDSEPFVFPGDAPAHGAPVSGTVVDLNVMVLRGSFRARIRRMRAVTDLRLSAEDSLVFSPAPVMAHARGRSWSLARGDALRFRGEMSCDLAPAEKAAVYLIEIFRLTGPA